MANGHDDPDYPPDDEGGNCAAEHDAAMNKYYDLKRAESDAVNAAKKAAHTAEVAMGVCAVGTVVPGFGAAACIAAAGAAIAALDDAKSKNDSWGVTIQQYAEIKKKLEDCIEPFTP